MNEDLYKKILEVLALGHFHYLDSQDKEIPDYAALFILQSKYSTEDYASVIKKFINWYKGVTI
jgi:hypothetical protein